jgi:anti-sigma B factor antagonist
MPFGGQPLYADELNALEIVVAVDGEVARVAISGELDGSSAPRLITTVHDIVSPVLRAIELDCAAVTFLDSAGVRALIVSRNEATHNGIDLVLVHPSPPVSRVIEMTGLVGLLT